MMTKYISVAVALLLAAFIASPIYSVGEAPWECLWGTGCAGVDSTDPTFTGTVTADEFDTPPALNDGGCVVLKECEDGTGCDTAGAGESLSICLPDNANPMTGDVERLPGYRVMFSSGGDIQYVEGVTHCAGIDVDDTANTCDTAPDSNTGDYGVPFLNSIWVGDCVVLSGDNDWTDVTDKIVYQLQVADIDNTTLIDIGDKFGVIEDGAYTSACAETIDGGVTVAVDAPGKTYTRSAGAFDTGGLYVGAQVSWSGFAGTNNGIKTIDTVVGAVMTVTDTVDTEGALTPTTYTQLNCLDNEDVALWAVQAGDDASRGYLQLRYDSATDDTGVDSNLLIQQSVWCEYF